MISSAANRPLSEVGKVAAVAVGVGAGVSNAVGAGDAAISAATPRVGVPAEGCALAVATCSDGEALSAGAGVAAATGRCGRL